MRFTIILLSFLATTLTSVTSTSIDLRNLTRSQGYVWETLYNPSITSAGDINHDGIDDLLIGWNLSPGSMTWVSVIYGKKGGLSPDLNISSSFDISQGFKIFYRYNAFSNIPLASSFASAGDINHDGIDDIVIGATNDSTNGNIFVIYGKKGGFSSNINLAQFDSSQGFKIYLKDLTDPFVKPAGDFNHDGIDDIIVFSLYSGDVFVIYGKKGGYSKTIDLYNGFNLNQGVVISGLPLKSMMSFSPAGDINNDGVDDIMFATSPTIIQDYSQGTVYVIYGQKGGFSSNLNVSAEFDLSKGFTISGPPATWYKSEKMTGFAGDINGDGIDDILVGVPFYECSQSYCGAAYVVYGRTGKFSANVDLASLDISQGFKITGAAGSQLGSFVSSVDANGDGINDIVVGAPNFSPPYSYEAGAVYVIYGQRSGERANVNLKNGLEESQGYQIVEAVGNSGSYGDINGDRVNDLLLTGSNSCYVLYSSTNFFDLFLFSIFDRQLD